jgi:hypothetical protein
MSAPPQVRWSGRYKILVRCRCLLTPSVIYFSLVLIKFIAVVFLEMGIINLGKCIRLRALYVPKKSKCIGQSIKTLTPKFSSMPHIGGEAGRRKDAGSDCSCSTNSGDFGEFEALRAALTPLA